MKKAKILFLSLILINGLSCKKPEGIFVGVGVELSVVGSSGKDLLNSIYTSNNIIVTHIVDGEELSPKQPLRIHKEDRYILTIFPRDLEEPNITLVQFGSLKPDNIRAHFIKSKGSLFCDKVWFNGVLKFDDSKQTNLIRRYFTIVK